MTDTENKGYTGWAIVELLGHVRIAGRVSEEPMFGTALMRIDVPDGDGYATQYAGGGSIYRLTPCTELVARAVVGATRPMPIEPWELKRLIQTPRPAALEPADADCYFPARHDDDCRCARGMHVLSRESGPTDGARILSVSECSSCGESHENVETRWIDPATEVFVCPTTGSQAQAPRIAVAAVEEPA